MKLIFLILSALILSNADAIAQKLYVWCPKEQPVKSRIGFLEKDTIDVVIFDGRLLTQNSKVECTSDDYIKSLGEFVKSTYPDAFINFKDTKHYYKDPLNNRITIKIGISAYHAAFGADVKLGIGLNLAVAAFPEGKWNAVTAYSIKMYDYRSGKQIKATKDIQKVASKSNTGGYRTARNILNSTYMEANQELLFFIDESLMR